MQQRSFLAIGVALSLAASMACQKSQGFSPTIPTATPVTPSDGSTLKVSAPSPQSPVNNVRLDTFTTPALVSGAASFTQGGSGTLQYHFQLFNAAGNVIQEATVSSTSWTPTIQLDFDQTYSWWVRAESSGAIGPWSAKASFISPNGGFFRGQQVFDPLTNARSVATRVVGGHFVTGANGGWQADGLGDGLDYDIPTCSACKA